MIRITNAREQKTTERDMSCALPNQLVRMQTLFPDQYDFFPPTWNFPEDLEHFQEHSPKDKIYILKPTTGSQVVLENRLFDNNRIHAPGRIQVRSCMELEDFSDWFVCEGRAGQGNPDRWWT